MVVYRWSYLCDTKNDIVFHKSASKCFACVQKETAFFLLISFGIKRSCATRLSLLRSISSDAWQINCLASTAIENIQTCLSSHARILWMHRPEIVPYLIWEKRATFPQQRIFFSPSHYFHSPLFSSEKKCITAQSWFFACIDGGREKAQTHIALTHV